MKVVKYLGILDSPYCLLIYLLKFTNQVEETYFFISDGIDEKIVKNLPQTFYVMGNSSTKSNLYFLNKMKELKSILMLNRILSHATKHYKNEGIICI